MTDIATPGTPAGGQDSTVNTVKEQAGNVAGTASGAAGDVVQTAKEQGREVAAETRRQARDLYDEAREQVRAQAGDQQQRAAGSLRRLSDELRSMADKSGESGPATELAKQASERAEDMASWLEARKPGELLDEVREYARRHPGAFLAGAALLGVLAGRLSRGVIAGAGGPNTANRTDVAASEPAVSTTRPIPVAETRPVVAAVPASTVEAAGGEYRR